MNHVQKDARIKLQLKFNDSPDVKNFWMLLNYGHKPTISHVAEYIKDNYSSIGKIQNQKSTYVVELYLDNYWLPPLESSRLLRENDCIE